MNKSVYLTRGFVFLNAIIWLAFSIIVATGMHTAIPDSEFYRWLMATLSLLSAAFLLLLYFMLKVRLKIDFLLSIVFLIFIALLTIMDDMGWIDFIVLAITLFPVVLLIKQRNWFLKTETS